MAEHVQAALDQMVAPLRDLMDRHIFTEEEIRAIVTRRRESEYLLRRRAARKADFIRYIEAEMMLEKLRALRTTKQRRDHRRAQRERGITDKDNREDKNSNEDPIGDVHVVQHIHLLFVRAIRKFRGDLALHIQHADFCKSVKSWTRLGRVYAEALQIFPREAGIWIEAASNEFFGPNRSVKSARVLLQRALRLNGNTSEELWLQYFILELHYAQTLKGRRKILRPSEGGVDDENNNDSDSGDDGEKESDQQSTDDPSDYNKIPMVILRNAIRSISKNVPFRLKFLDACQQFPDTADLMDYVQTSMAIDFADEPESWIARAIYQAEKLRTDEPSSKRAKIDTDETDSNNNPVISVLQDAIDTLPKSKMLIQAFRFAEDYKRELEDSEDAEAMEKVESFIQELWTKAKDGSTTSDSSELAMEETRYLLREGNQKQALKTIKMHCTSVSQPGGRIVPSEAWLLWASLSGTSLKKQKSILKMALQSIPVDQHPDYVVILLQYFAAQLKVASLQNPDDDNNDSDSEKNLFETLQNLLLLAPKTVGEIVVESTGLDFELSTVFEAYRACLDHFYERKGISGARSIYEAVLFRSTACSQQQSSIQKFVDRCLEIEQEQNTESSKAKRRVLCKLYDRVVDIFAGTPLEDSYRHDRNELAVYAT